MSTIVVTGATGHLGKHIVQGLLASGVPATDIVAAGRNADKLAPFAAKGVRTAQIDFTKPETLEAAFADADKVVLVSASEPGQRFAQHRAAIDAAKNAGVSQLVYTSILKADTTPHVLAPEHKATEEYLRASGVPFTILRNGWYTENYAATVDQARESGVLASSVGDGRVASASRKDYADAAVAVVTTDDQVGKTYELTGDYAWSQDELAGALSELTGRAVAFTNLTPEAQHAALVAAGLDEGTAGFVVAMDANTRDGLLANTNGELSGLIGRPTAPLVEGLRETLVTA